jgi:hypothetical protein
MSIEVPKLIKNLIQICIFFPLASLSAAVCAQSNINLHDVLSATIEKQSNSSRLHINELAAEKSFVAWLDGAPSVSLMRFESQQALGTTETEISVNLPFKSPFLKHVEKSLASEIESLRESAQQQYALYLSGLIRDLLWELEFEKASLKMLDQKQQVLSALATQYEDMAAVQAIPQYVLLVVQNELNQQALSSLQHKQNIKNLRDRYFRLSGLYLLPDEIAETPLNIEQFNMNSHPDILALDATFESTQQQLLSASKKTEAWNVQLMGRRISTPEFSENQIGVGIELPIVIGNNLSAVQQSEYVKLSTEHTISRNKLKIELSEAQIKLSQEYDFLLQKQQLLDKGLPILNSLSEAMDELREANAPNQEFYIRTLLNTIESAQNVELNQLHIQRHIALIKQASGITL